MFQLFLECFTKKYVKFSGRASRREYWSFQLFSFIFLMIITIILFSSITIYTHDDAMRLVAILFFFIIPILLPGLALSVRRLHDLNVTGLVLLINAVPYIGFISSLIMMIAFCFRGSVGDNKYGPDPIAQD